MLVAALGTPAQVQPISKAALAIGACSFIAGLELEIRSLAHKSTLLNRIPKADVPRKKFAAARKYLHQRIQFLKDITVKIRSNGLSARGFAEIVQTFPYLLGGAGIASCIGSTAFINSLYTSTQSTSTGNVPTEVPQRSARQTSTQPPPLSAQTAAETNTHGTHFTDALADKKKNLHGASTRTKQHSTIHPTEARQGASGLNFTDMQAARKNLRSLSQAADQPHNSTENERAAAFAHRQNPPQSDPGRSQHTQDQKTTGHAARRPLPPLPQKNPQEAVLNAVLDELDKLATEHIIPPSDPAPEPPVQEPTIVSDTLRRIHDAAQKSPHTEAIRRTLSNRRTHMTASTAMPAKDINNSSEDAEDWGSPHDDEEPDSYVKLCLLKTTQTTPRATSQTADSATTQSVASAEPSRTTASPTTDTIQPEKTAAHKAIFAQIQTPPHLRSTSYSTLPALPHTSTPPGYNAGKINQMQNNTSSDDDQRSDSDWED